MVQYGTRSAFVKRTSVGLVLVLPQVIAALASLGALRIYTEWLDPRQFGFVMLALSGIGLVQILVSSAGAQSVFYFASRYGTGAVYRLFGGALRLAALLASGTLAVSIAQMLLGSSGTDAGFFLAAGLCGLGLATDFFRAGLQSLLNVAKLRGRFGVLLVFDSAAMPFFALLAFANHAGLQGFLLAVAASRSAGLLLSRALSRNLTDDESITDIAPAWRDVLQYAFPFSLMGLVGWSTSSLDRFVLAYAAGPAIAGVYALAGSLVARPYSIATAALSVHFRPELFSGATREDLNEPFWAWVRFAVLTGATGSFLFLLTGPLIAQLLVASNYIAEVIPLLLAFSLAYGCTLIVHACENRFLARGENRCLLLLQLAYLPVPLILLLILTQSWDVKGAVAARVLSEILRIAVIAGWEFARSYLASKGIGKEAEEK